MWSTVTVAVVMAKAGRPIKGGGLLDVPEIDGVKTCWYRCYSARAEIFVYSDESCLNRIHKVDASRAPLLTGMDIANGEHYRIWFEEYMKTFGVKAIHRTGWVLRPIRQHAKVR